jgi:hypothetical protein
MARMPPTHAQPLTPRLGQTTAGAKVAAALPTRKPVPVPAPVPRTPPAAPPPPAAVADDDDAAEAKARAGGFHESSYELKQGLDVSESEWPPDITAPGALGLR